MTFIWIIKDIWKRFRCKHEFVFMMNLYGDAIFHNGDKRSIWRCVHCEEYQSRDQLHE